MARIHPRDPGVKERLKDLLVAMGPEGSER
jgi:hypothetical protein